jgi:hypothetical protein
MSEEQIAVKSCNAATGSARSFSTVLVLLVWALGAVDRLRQANNLFVTPQGVSGNNTHLQTQTNLGYDVGEL